ncbi:MAG: stage II sporulation protein M [Lachnospiraceae bacterium]|nr:stage II sporulation protein M [Lachnospiraceae bacterium]
MNISNDMPREQKKSNKFLCYIHPLESLVFLFIISMTAGCLITNLLFENLFSSAFIDFKTDTGLIVTIGDKKKSLLLYYLFLHARVFFLLVFFSFTNVWKLYSRSFLCYTGIVQGILLIFCIHQEKLFKGILEYFCFLLPHALLLFPLYLFSFLHLQKMHDKLFFSATRKQKRELFFKQLPFCLFAFLILFIASFLEAYVNLPLLTKVLPS